MSERAVLAGGCFWGMQDLIRKRDGVLATRVGYTGGDVPNATYRNHGTHAEGIEIIFDPARISYRQVLELFFQIHDPTTRNRQGNDVGMSYRSAIYYCSDAQRDEAMRTIADVEASGLWPGKVVTEVEPVGDFWEAEPEHQDYLQRFPGGYTCHFPRPTGCCPAGRQRRRAEAGADSNHAGVLLRRAGDIGLGDAAVVAHDLEDEQLLRQGLGPLHPQRHRLGGARVEHDDVGLAPRRQRADAVLQPERDGVAPRDPVHRAQRVGRLP